MSFNNIGIVIIGRNEGQRLIDCLDSIPNDIEHRVYVDSDSSDNSVANARECGCEVLELDLSIPFTAGRARNEGFQLLTQSNPHLEYVQFIDGDCTTNLNWFLKALERLESSEELAIVCGRRKEKFPKRTIYNQLCDIEWNTPVGIASESGGDFLIKKDVFKNVGGFNPVVIAGEEPEMCFRIRELGHTIERIDELMTEHDANMTSIKQWWKRTLRCGHAYAEGFYRHGNSEERYNKRPTISALIWFSFLPIFLLMSVITPWSLLLFLIFPLQVVRLWLKNTDKPKAFSYALFLVLGKIPEAFGIMKFYSSKLLNKERTIIEYK